MSSSSREERRSHTEWQQQIIDEQDDGVPKERGRTYYYADGLFDRSQIWLKHNPGCNIAMRVEKVWQPGIMPDEDYSSSLQMNIGTEKDAYRLYRALEAYFHDARTPPWFLQDTE